MVIGIQKFRILCSYIKQNDIYAKIRGKLSKDHNILKRIIFEQHEIIKDRDIVSRNPGFDENTNLILAGLRRAGKTTMLYQLVCKLAEKGWRTSEDRK